MSDERLSPEPAPASTPERVPVEELIDLDALGTDGHRPSKRRIRAALPRGWVLEDDGLHARRDLRLLFREGWILIAGLVAFGSVGVAFLWGAMPRGLAGLGRLAALVAVVLLVGGVVGPIVSRALQGKR